MTRASKLCWVRPQDCVPPHKVTRPDQVVDLANAFLENGWDYEAPVLIGYQWAGEIQLLSGSHRWAAAVKVGLERIPVLIHPQELVWQAWGTDRWAEIMSGPPVHRMLSENTEGVAMVTPTHHPCVSPKPSENPPI